MIIWLFISSQVDFQIFIEMHQMCVVRKESAVRHQSKVTAQSCLGRLIIGRISSLANFLLVTDAKNYGYMIDEGKRSIHRILLADSIPPRTPSQRTALCNFDCLTGRSA